MKLTRVIKTVLVCASVLGVVVWFASARSSQAVSPGANNAGPAIASTDPSEYVGSDACKDCHEDQFKAYSHTTHAQLSRIGSWKGKVTGCESCHGPGKDHIAEGDPAKIISFKNKSSKETAETCLSCHAGKEERNNFRRGEHWRNDIGCTDCHAPHSETATARPARFFPIHQPSSLARQQKHFCRGATRVAGRSSQIAERNTTAPNATTLATV